MKLYSCGNCQQNLFFESVQCIQCGQGVAYLPDRDLVCAMEVVNPAEDIPPAATQVYPVPVPVSPPILWRVTGDDGDSRRYRPCRNLTDHNVCNWAVSADDDNPLCLACRLNHIIPPLDTPGMRQAWHDLEIAKRRLLYNVYLLRLPVEGKAELPDGIQFNFMTNNVSPDQPHVVTGHANGVITINAAEAEDSFREKMRLRLGESYRTVLGHLRHESGHYYWERLIKSGARLTPFRELFGDEQKDYAESQKEHYTNGAPADWPTRFVSGYASMHPWEDWAETWSHYLHLVDTLETANSYSLSLQPRTQTLKGGKNARELAIAASHLDLRDFDDLISSWLPLTVALNNLNRSMGMKDCYPFVLSTPAINKLRFVHEVVLEAADSRSTSKAVAHTVVTAKPTHIEERVSEAQANAQANVKPNVQS